MNLKDKVPNSESNSKCYFWKCMAVEQLIMLSITSTGSNFCAGKLNMWLTFFVIEKKKAQMKEHKKASK